jgi:hypothetical protein
MRLSKTIERKQESAARVNALRHGVGGFMAGETKACQKEGRHAFLKTDAALPSSFPTKCKNFSAKNASKCKNFSGENDSTNCVNSQGKKNRRSAARIAAGLRLKARLEANRAKASKTPPAPRTGNVLHMADYRRKAR